MAEAVSAIQVFLVADHAALRENAGLLLADEHIIVLGWATAADTMQMEIPAGTDVIVIALAAGNDKVICLLRELASRPDPPPAVIVSADDDSRGRTAISAGAAGFVSNRRAHEALPAVIRETAARRWCAPNSPEKT